MSRIDPQASALRETHFEPVPAHWQQPLIETCRQNFDWLKPVSDLEIQRVQSTAFSGAQIFQLSSAKLGRFALRLWPTGALPVERLAGLHALLRHTQQLGLPVAVPFSVATGTTSQASATYFRMVVISPYVAGISPLILNESGQEIGYLSQLEPWLSGKPLDSTRLEESEATAVISTVARWHTAASSFVSPPISQTWFAPSHQGISPTVVKCLTRLSATRTNLAHQNSIERGSRGSDSEETHFTNSNEIECLGKICKVAKLVDELAPSMTRLLTPWAHQAVQLTPCWGDFWCRHVLTEHGQVSGLLDPTAARTDSVAIDLARFLGSFHFVKPSIREHCFEVYHGIRPLSELDVRLARVMENVGLLMAGLFWIESPIWKTSRVLQRQYLPDWQMISIRLDWLLCRLSSLQAEML